MLETVRPVHCLVKGCVFDSDFDFDFAQGFALRAAHQNDLRWRLVPALIPGRQVCLALAQKKVACCDAARYFVFSFKSARIIANQA